MKIVEDSPERLREVLIAMSEHTGLDGFRIQFDFRKDGSSRMLVTHSRGADAEVFLATLVAAVLKDIHGVAEIRKGEGDAEGFGEAPAKVSP